MKLENSPRKRKENHRTKKRIVAFVWTNRKLEELSTVVNTFFALVASKNGQRQQILVPFANGDFEKSKNKTPKTHPSMFVKSK